MESLKGKHVLVTGGAGFIGSNMCSALLNAGAYVTAYDNLSYGNYSFIKDFEQNLNFNFVKEDLLNIEALEKALRENSIDTVIHLAANPDIRKGHTNTDLDLKQGTIATYNVMEAARKTSVKNIMFSSSSVVYGRAAKLPTPEEYGPLKPISLYGSSKLASEGLITAFSHLFGFNYYIYRFANVVGKNQTHGVIIDFIKKLRANSNELEVLGNGTQKKAYIDVEDCVNGMLFAFERSNEKENIFNISTDEQTSVAEIADAVIKRVAPNARIRYTGTEQGWPGDVTNAFLSAEKLKALGWKPRMGSKQAVEHAIELAINAASN